MNIELRPEIPNDHFEVEKLTREAFWNVHVPGCDEHYLAHIMRKCEAFIPELDLVAVLDNKIIGNIMYTKAVVECDDRDAREVLCFGPVSVLPEYQGRGVGGQLITHTMELAREMGASAILIYGDPDYYGRFGFVQAERYGIRTADDMYAVPLLARELVKGALAGMRGRFIEDKVFDIDAKAAKEFDIGFPAKEKLSDTPSQKRFRELVNIRKRP
jgi:predicted N-acetyltransferase YhbS